MSASLWTWAVTTVLDVVTAIFGYAITMLGVATTSIVALILMSAVFRLIVAPIVGNARLHMIDNAMYGTSREIARSKRRSVSRATQQSDGKNIKWTVSSRKQ